MSKGYEIERKFLVDFPKLDELNLKKKLAIYQTYLEDDETGAQRRVRRIECDGDITYTYTEKIFLTAVTRKEFECEIDESEYRRLVIQARNDCSPIEKIRYCFEHNNQLFELDTYPFSDEMAILEIELEKPEQDIDFPDNVSIIKEVTGDSKYANAAIATAGEFPDQY